MKNNLYILLLLLVCCRSASQETQNTLTQTLEIDRFGTITILDSLENVNYVKNGLFEALAKEFDRPVLSEQYLSDFVKIYSCKIDDFQSPIPFTNYYYLTTPLDENFHSILGQTAADYFILFENSTWESEYTRSVEFKKNRVVVQLSNTDGITDRIEIYNFNEGVFTKEISDSNRICAGAPKPEMNCHYRLDGEIENGKYLNGEVEMLVWDYRYNNFVWTNGVYKNGNKDGEWYISPNGPAELRLMYNKGVIESQELL